MANKRYQFAVLFVFLAIVVSNDAKNLNVGSRLRQDRMIHTAPVKVGSDFFGVVTWKETFSGNGRISQIRLIDHHKNNKGANPIIVSGGPGEFFVTIEFISQKGQGIDYNVTLYGNENYF